MYIACVGADHRGMPYGPEADAYTRVCAEPCADGNAVTDLNLRIVFPFVSFALAFLCFFRMIFRSSRLLRFSSQRTSLGLCSPVPLVVWIKAPNPSIIDI